MLLEGLNHAELGKNRPRGYEVGWPFEKYVKLGGEFHGKNLRETLEQLVHEKGLVRLLDVGCGKGNGLQLPLIFRIMHPGKVERHGITIAEFRSPFKKFCHWMNATHITMGDAHHLSEYFSQGYFDVVMSHFALGYMDQRKVLPQIVKVMAPGGLAFLHGGSRKIAESIPTVEEFGENYVGVTFRKQISQD